MRTKGKTKDCQHPEEVKAHILSGGVIAIVRGDFRGWLIPIAEVLIEAGLPAIEVTMNSPDALSAIEELSQSAGDRLLVGAGTVIDPADVDKIAAVAGRFVVSPNVNRAVIEAAEKADLLAIPGAFTATEILEAWQFGAGLVKLFPASAGGPDYLRAIRGPLGHIPLVPTGGITTDNAAAFMAAGAAALGVGSKLVNPDVFAAGGLERLRGRAEHLMAAMAEGRAGG